MMAEPFTMRAHQTGGKDLTEGCDGVELSEMTAPLNAVTPFNSVAQNASNARHPTGLRKRDAGPTPQRYGWTDLLVAGSSGRSAWRRGLPTDGRGSTP